MKLRTALTALTLITLPASLSAPAALAAKDPIYKEWNSNAAIQGYDPVAYFKEGEPVKGSKEFTTEYMGADFRFASQENLDTFLAEPSTYAPQYGGYCAWAAADGKTAKGNAKNWAIVDGKLYLNYNKSIQDKWDADREGFITKADAEWPSLLD